MSWCYCKMSHSGFIYEFSYDKYEYWYSVPDCCYYKLHKKDSYFNKKVITEEEYNNAASCALKVQNDIYAII